MDTYTLEQESPSSEHRGNGKPRRRLRTVEEKTKIVQETLAPGVSVAEVARRHGLNANLLFNWRRQYQQGVLENRTPQPRAVKLLPVKVAEPVSSASPPATGKIEIEWPDKVRVRLVGEVSTEQLTTVLAALAQRR